MQQEVKESDQFCNNGYFVELVCRSFGRNVSVMTESPRRRCANGERLSLREE